MTAIMNGAARRRENVAWIGKGIVHSQVSSAAADETRGTPFRAVHCIFLDRHD
jgi:hypothetical protein